MALSHWYAGVLGACGLLLVGCQSSDFDLQLEQEAEGVTLLQLSSEGGFVLPAIPDDNPLTDAK
ncbi:hypothetical protein, partial [Gilvimarinus sp. 1_MG-2023]